MIPDTLRPPPALCGFLADYVGTFPSSRELPGVMRRPSSVSLARTPSIVQRQQDCVAVSGADAYLYELVVQREVPEPDRLFNDPDFYASWLPSRRKLYWDARARSGNERVDGGTRPSAFVLAVNEKGVCAERWCPYEGLPEENPLADNDAAGRLSFDQAGKVELFECRTLDDALDVIAAGHRVLYAAPVYESMMQVDGETMYEPSGARMGNHMWQLVGYENGGALVRMKNQWPGWGDQHQEALVRREVLEDKMLVALAFSRVARFSETRRAEAT